MVLQEFSRWGKEKKKKKRRVNLGPSMGVRVVSVCGGEDSSLGRIPLNRVHSSSQTFPRRPGRSAPEPGQHDTAGRTPSRVPLLETHREERVCKGADGRSRRRRGAQAAAMFSLFVNRPHLHSALHS